MSLTGRISEWKRERGFGYLDCEGRRVFLHCRDFKERHKSSKGPDQFVFVLIIGRHQFLAIDVLRGWPFIHLGAQLVRKLF